MQNSKFSNNPWIVNCIQNSPQSRLGSVVIPTMYRIVQKKKVIIKINQIISKIIISIVFTIVKRDEKFIKNSERRVNLLITEFYIINFY